MANRFYFANDLPFELRIKSLADDELLDIWEETQSIDRVIKDDWASELIMPQEFEQLIVSELQYRNGLKSLPFHR